MVNRRDLGDYDHDGFLDLFVPATRSSIPIIRRSLEKVVFRQVLPVSWSRSHVRSAGLPGEGDHLFHNNGDGTFTDVSVKAGVADAKGYYGFSSVFVDVDDDGWVDLAWRTIPCQSIFTDKHDGTFEDISYLSGFALNDDGREQAAMGIAVGDYNRDGKVDFTLRIFPTITTRFTGRRRRDVCRRQLSGRNRDTDDRFWAGARAFSTSITTGGLTFSWPTARVSGVDLQDGGQPGRSVRCYCAIWMVRNSRRCLLRLGAASPWL